MKITGISRTILPGRQSFRMILSCVLCLFVATGCSPSEPPPNLLQIPPGEWASVFNGKNLQGWKESPDIQMGTPGEI
ncbi:hypothetical protein ACFLZR_00585, partial [Candidatus Neomarinimicrobiota bacterium]